MRRALRGFLPLLPEKMRVVLSLTLGERRFPCVSKCNERANNFRHSPIIS
jgi:hypothetical protein